MDPQETTEHDYPHTTYRVYEWSEESGAYKLCTLLGYVDDFPQLNQAMRACEDVVAGWELRPERYGHGLYSICGTYFIKPVF